MNRTPIRIPGKRRHPGSTAAAKASKTSHKLETSSQQNASATRRRANAANAAKASASSQGPSLLELLPTELLWMIHLYALNMDLPIASHILAKKLRSPLLYTRTVTYAFEHDWHRHYRAVHDLATADETEEELTRRGELQSRLLRCRWANLQIFLEAQDVWLRRFANCTTEILADEVAIFRADYECSQCHPYHLSSPSLSLESVFREFNLAISHFSWDGARKWIDRCFRMSPQTELPEHMFRGPWDDTQTRYLFFLITSLGGPEFGHLVELARIQLLKAHETGNRTVATLIYLLTDSETSEITLEFTLDAIRYAGKDKLRENLEDVLRQCYLEHPNGQRVGEELLDMEVEALRDKNPDLMDRVKFIRALAEEARDIVASGLALIPAGQDQRNGSEAP